MAQQGLSVSRLVNVSINLQPLGAALRSFGDLMVVGDSNVIDGQERLREYVDLESVAADFGTTAPEYLAAVLFYEQSPQPENLTIARWLRTATAGILRGGVLTGSEQLISSWTSITSGGFTIPVDGSPVTVTGLNFSAAGNMNAVAAIINTGLTTHATCVWNGSQFIITSATTGTSSAIGYTSAPGSGTDISAKTKTTLAIASVPVPGYAAETPVDCIAALANQSADWYGVMFAASVMPNTSQVSAVGALVEGLSVSRLYGVTETSTTVLDAGNTADLASTLKALGYKRSFVQYSSTNPYAVASFFGRAFSVNFNANRSTITLMYKQEPGIVAEILTETQAQTLKTKRCNVFVAYQNNTAIIQYGTMAGPAYFDEMHGLDWFQNALQTAEYNLLYQSTTKIPQTDAGMNQIKNIASSVCDASVNNGLVAPGVWNADGFGQLQRGQFLKQGYYIYVPPMALQDQSTREQRIAPPMQIALKLAGAIQELDVIVNVNR